MVVKRVGVWSFARMAGLIYAIIGFIAGVIIAFVSFLGALSAAASELPFVGALLGVGAIFLLPIFYGLIGLVVGGLVGLVYNALASVVGGIELELE
jgi:hypothetical protein